MTTFDEKSVIRTNNILTFLHLPKESKCTDDLIGIEELGSHLKVEIKFVELKKNFY